jgi:hypothetical protein
MGSGLLSMTPGINLNFKHTLFAQWAVRVS